MKVKDLLRVCENYFSYILVLNSNDKTEVLEEYHEDLESFEDKYSNSTVNDFIIYDGDNGDSILEITLR